MKGNRAATFWAFHILTNEKTNWRQEREAAKQVYFATQLQEMDASSSEAELASRSDKSFIGSPALVENTGICKRKKTKTNAFIPSDILSRPSLVRLSTWLKITPIQQAAFNVAWSRSQVAIVQRSPLPTQQQTERGVTHWRPSVRNSTSSGHHLPLVPCTGTANWCRCSPMCASWRSV